MQMNGIKEYVPLPPSYPQKRVHSFNQQHFPGAFSVVASIQTMGTWCFINVAQAGAKLSTVLLLYLPEHEVYRVAHFPQLTMQS